MLQMSEANQWGQLISFFIFPFLKSKSWRNEACLDHMWFSGKYLHCSGWEVEGLFLCISVFSCGSTLLAHAESPFVWNIPFCLSPLGIARAKPSNLVGWRIICGEETSWYLPEMCYVRESVSQMPPQGLRCRGPALQLTCPGTVGSHLSLTNCVHLAAIFSKTLTQWYFATTSILFLSDLEDYSDSMLAGQP